MKTVKGTNGGRNEREQELGWREGRGVGGKELQGRRLALSLAYLLRTRC